MNLQHRNSFFGMYNIEINWRKSRGTNGSPWTRPIKPPAKYVIHRWTLPKIYIFGRPELFNLRSTSLIYHTRKTWNEKIKFFFFRPNNLLPYDEIDADDAVRFLSLVSVNHGGLSENPHVSSAFRQKPVPSGFRLPFRKYC